MNPWLFGAVVALGDIEQVRARLARGDDGAVGPIQNGDGDDNDQDQQHGQADDGEQHADDDLLGFHRCFGAWQRHASVMMGLSSRAVTAGRCTRTAGNPL